MLRRLAPTERGPLVAPFRGRQHMVYQIIIVALAPLHQHGKPRTMNEDSLTNILMRIQSAIGRIETAASNRATPGNDELELAYADLESRHNALKRTAQQTLNELDTLIGSAIRSSG